MHKIDLNKYCLMIRPVEFDSEIVDTICRVTYDRNYRATSIDTPRDGRFPIDKNSYKEPVTIQEIKNKSDELCRRELPLATWCTEEMNTLLKSSAEYFRDNVYRLKELGALDYKEKEKSAEGIGKLFGVIAAIATYFGCYCLMKLLRDAGMEGFIFLILGIAQWILPFFAYYMVIDMSTKNVSTFC